MKLAKPLIPLALGTLLTVLFWPKLWQGGGFIGGDTYTYFLPQKAFFADRLKAGEFPLWNNLVGHGYPLIGESQTAAFYPLTVPLYGLLDLNTAYVANHLLHYIAAFVAAWLLATRLGIRGWGAALAATVYVYGWFPPRACLEWAIIGGVYLPLALWCAESYCQTPRRRYLAGLSLAFAADLLAGHFHLAFITTVTVLGYVGLRWWLIPTESPQAAGGSEGTSGPAPPRGATIVGGVLAAVVLGYGLAGPQLVPSWDLLRSSQRTRTNEEFDPGYGHIPPWYLSQVVTPWRWYPLASKLDGALNSDKRWSIPSLTNKVEAHLYFGLAPLALAGFACWPRASTGRRPERRLLILCGLGLCGVLFATGWLLPVAEYLPGFSYFRGPGRYGVVITLAVGLLAGTGFNRVLSRLGGAAPLAAMAIFGVTVADLWWVADQQWYTFQVSDPPIRFRADSNVARELAKFEGLPRMLAPGSNLATLTGFAASPPYLGFGPDAYYREGGHLPDTRFLKSLSSDDPPEDIDVDRQFEWLRDAGITHLLSMRSLPANWPVRKVWEGFDPLLNPSWARWNEPLYLYVLRDASGYVLRDASGYVVRDAPGRTRIESGDSQDFARVTEDRANRVRVKVETQAGGKLELRDLPWHEWELTIDGHRVEAAEQSNGTDITTAGLLRRTIPVPAGVHVVEWTYRPVSLWWGCAAWALSTILLGLLLRLRRPVR